MIRVVLVEDEMLVRQGIRGLLGLTGDITVVAEAVDGEDALRVIPRYQPDVVLLDVRMPKGSGIDVLEALRSTGTLPPTILLTTFDDDAALLKGIRSGARGFLLKDVSIERLTEAIRAVAAGGTILRPAITEHALKRLGEAPTEFESLEWRDPLTRREIEVLGLMAGGFSNREIGDALGATEGTVKNHISNILSKLGVRDRIRAVLKGLETGLI
ncbi:MAG: response regulator transcription factor [Holophaga sp.]|nr:response regulator transcription factor [Holophaga sp.]